MTDRPKTPHYLIRRYDLHLPVFKQGDDLAAHLREGLDSKAALEALAHRYEVAAERCRGLAAVAGECAEVSVEGDTHVITVVGPFERLDALADEDGPLAVSSGEESDRAAVAEILREVMWSKLEDHAEFTVEELVARLPCLDEEGDLNGLNPAWVREELDILVEAKCLKRVESGKYRICEEEPE